MSLHLFQDLIFLWIVIAVIVFFVLLKIPAPYGRHATTSWGPMIDNRLAWFIMEFIVLVTFYFFIWKNPENISPVSWVMIVLFTYHYVDRSIIFPLKLQTRGKKMPVIIMISAMLFNFVNGSSLGYYFTHFAHYPDNWWRDPRFITGIVLFFSGRWINKSADEILIHLRKPGETGYQIPYGGLFNYISCPNHFGEIIEWLGFALMCWNIAGLAFFIWTCANLVPRALSHHHWYREKFPGYPKNRKAIFPAVL